MNVLITGATGFVGKILTVVVKERYPDARITAGFYNPIPSTQEADLGIDFYFLDLLNSANIDAVLKRRQYNWIIHLAGQSSVSNSWEIPSQTN